MAWEMWKLMRYAIWFVIASAVAMTVISLFILPFLFIFIPFIFPFAFRRKWFRRERAVRKVWAPPDWTEEEDLREG
ncbi:MAG: hypothetical protein ABIH76_08300 [Candidatus Bathyarchaeota archaeon]